MRESRTYGSVRGALSNGCPYRVKIGYRIEDRLMSAHGTERTYMLQNSSLRCERAIIESD